MATRRVTPPTDGSPKGASSRRSDSTHVSWSAPGAKPVMTPAKSRADRIEVASRSRGATGGSARGSGARAGTASRVVSSSSANATNDASSTGVARGNNAEMIVTGLMAAVYFLTTVAWLIVALRSPIEFADLLANSMFILGLWVAVAAGPLWFVGIMVFGRELGFGRRLTLYVIGALLIIPWPYLSWAAG